MRLSLVLAFLILLAACHSDEPVTDWRVSIKLPDSEVPVSLHLDPDKSVAWFANGSEKVMVPEVLQQGESWRLRFPAFNNEILLKQSGNQLEGTLTLVKLGYEQVMPVTALPDPGYRFLNNPQPSVDVTGRWDVQFVEDDGTKSSAVGEFDQQGSQVTGTFLTAKGDYRYLAGEVHERTMYLSTFDGAHAFVFEAELLETGELSGHFWSGTKWHESWTAKRDFEATLPDAYSLTYLKDGYDRLEFSFPDLEGNLVSLGDEKYRDKVVLVTLSGSWCPNCADEMEFLADYYRDNQQRGLEIITLLYEHFEEFELAAEQGRALVDKHEIGFDVLIAGLSDKDQAAETLPMLNHVLAYPTTMFIDRAGEVKEIHTGFAGPGTGTYYEAFKKTFFEKMDRLLDQ